MILFYFGIFVLTVQFNDRLSIISFHRSHVILYLERLKMHTQLGYKRILLVYQSAVTLLFRLKSWESFITELSYYIWWSVFMCWFVFSRSIVTALPYQYMCQRLIYRRKKRLQLFIAYEQRKICVINQQIARYQALWRLYTPRPF